MTTITRERLPDHSQELPDRLRKSKQQVMSARDLLEMPTYATIPVSHCATPSNLQPIDLVIMGTIISIAKMLADEANREQAREHGRAYRERELQNYEEFGARWRARRKGEPYVIADADVEYPASDVPTILHTFEYEERIKPLKVRVAVRRAMSEGYKQKLTALRKHRPDAITFRASLYLLLTAARLSNSTSNRAAIVKGLRRLRKQGLLAFDATDSDLTITVKPECLRRQYHRLPLPLPTRSKLALQLLLWLQHAKPKPQGKDKRSVSISHLQRLFRHGDRFRQALHRAVATINAYLRPLDADALADQLKITLPGSYSFEVTGSNIRFATSTETIMKRKTKRRRVIVRERLEEPAPAPAHPDTRPPIYRVPLSRMDALEDYMEAAGFQPYRFEAFSRLRDPVLIDLRDRLTLRFLGQDETRRSVHRERI